MIPSKKILILILLVFGCFGMWFLSRSVRDTKQVPANIQDTKTDTSVTSAQNDTDNDGLKDWEEQLHNTNIRIRDTDGDGVSDGEEVRGGYDPAVYGQGVNFNITPAQDVFDEFAFTPFQGEKNQAPNLKEALQTNVIGVNEKYIPILNEMATSITRYPVIETTDNEIFTVLFTPGNSILSQMARYEKIIEHHRRIAASLQDIVYKEGLELEIIRLVQGYNRVADSLEKLVLAYPQYAESKTQYVDSVIEYSNAVVSLQRQLYTVTEFIYAKGIQFKADDPGVLFLFGG